MLAWSLLPEAARTAALAITCAWQGLTAGALGALLLALQAVTARAGPSPVWLLATALLEATSAAPVPAPQQGATSRATAAITAQARTHAAALSRCLDTALQAQASLPPPVRHACPWVACAVSSLYAAWARVVTGHRMRVVAAEGAIEALAHCWQYCAAATTAAQRAAMVRSHTAFRGAGTAAAAAATSSACAIIGRRLVCRFTSGPAHLSSLPVPGGSLTALGARPAAAAAAATATPLSAGTRAAAAAAPRAAGISVGSAAELLLHALAMDYALCLLPPRQASASAQAGGRQPGPCFLGLPVQPVSYAATALAVPTMQDEQRLALRVQVALQAVATAAAASAAEPAARHHPAPPASCRLQLLALLARLRCALAASRLQACDVAAEQGAPAGSAFLQFVDIGSDRQVQQAMLDIAVAEAAAAAIEDAAACRKDPADPRRS